MPDVVLMQKASQDAAMPQGRRRIPATAPHRSGAPRHVLGAAGAPGDVLGSGRRDEPAVLHLGKLVFTVATVLGGLLRERFSEVLRSHLD